jgi:hypothetical protein
MKLFPLALLGMIPWLSCIMLARADGVAVGSSTLIVSPDISDSFTIGPSASSGTRNGLPYTPGAYPLTNTGAGGNPNANIVESTYGTSHELWNASGFSISNDANRVTGYANAYSGTSGGGSVSGITQTGLTAGSGSSSMGTDFGVAYGQRTNFVVQFDAVQLNDRIDINIGNTNNTFNSSDGLSVFFRQGNIGLSSANSGLFETLTGFDPNLLDNTWNNYAVDFDLPDKSLSFYVNQNFLGSINLYTFDGGAYLNVLDADSNDFVSVGGAEPNPYFGGSGGATQSQIGILWTDNFEIGAPVATPEPGTLAMMVGGLVLLGLGLRRKWAAPQI